MTKLDLNVDLSEIKQVITKANPDVKFGRSSKSTILEKYYADHKEDLLSLLDDK